MNIAEEEAIGLSKNLAYIIDLTVPQSYDNITQSIEKLAKDYENENNALSMVNLSIKGVLITYTQLCKKYPANGANLKKIVKGNIAKLLFIVWRIDPFVLYKSDICENYVLGKEFPAPLFRYEWEQRMRSNRHNFDLNLLCMIFLNSINL
jgi:hypothetical protein